MKGSDGRVEFIVANAQSELEADQAGRYLVARRHGEQSDRAESRPLWLCGSV